MIIDKANANKVTAVTLLIIVLWLIWQLLIAPYTELLYEQYIDFERSQRKIIALNELLIHKKKINFKLHTKEALKWIMTFLKGSNNGKSNLAG